MNMAKPLAVLIVEDNKSDAQLIVRLFNKAGYSLTFEQVETGAQMRGALEKQAWEVVISDFSMPELDGFAALKVLQETGLDIPFIVVSGTMGEETAVAMMKAGAHDYVMKGNLARLIPAVERELIQVEARWERKQAEEALRAIEHQHRVLIETALDGFFLVDKQGGLLEVNETYCRMSGYTKQELLGMHIPELESLESAGDTGSHIQKIIEQGEDRFVSQHRRKDGSVFDVEISVQYRAEEGGRFVAFLQDITERKRAEEQITYQAKLLSSVKDAVIGTDIRYHIQYFNAAAQDLYGWKAEEVLGHSMEEFIQNEYLQDTLEDVLRHITENGYWTGEVNQNHRDGTRIPILATVSAIKDNHCQTTGFVAVNRDITERKRAEILQGALYKIAQATDQSQNLDALFPSIHAIIRNVMVADNFYIALYDEKHNMLSFPYSVDEVDHLVAPEKLGKGLTEYVIRTSKSLLCDESLFEDLIQRGEVELIGLTSEIWLGVPLLIGGKAIGVMAVQDYKNAGAYGEREQRILEFVSSQAAIAIQRKRAEEKLREETLRLAGILEGTNAGTWEWNIQTGETLINARWAEMIGYSMDEISSLGYETRKKCSHPDDRKVSDELLEKHFRGEIDYYEIEKRMKHKDGNWVWILDRGKVISWTEDGKPLLMMGTHQDISEGKQAETINRLISETQDLLLRPIKIEDIHRLVSEKVRELIGDGITATSMLDEEHQTVRMGSYHGLDVPMEKLISILGIDAYKDISLADMSEADLRIYRSGRLENLEGGIYTLVTRMVPKPACLLVEKLLRVKKVYTMGFVHENKHLGGLVILARSDITPFIPAIEQIVELATIAIERIMAEEYLRESEQRFHSLFESMLNGFAYCKMIFDQERPQDFIYLDVNRAFEALTGLKDVVGKKVSEVIPGILESDPGLIDTYGRVALTGIPETFETYVESLKMWFHLSVYSPRKEYFVAVFDVITERKQAEQRMKEYSENLEAMVTERTRALTDAQEKLIRQERLAVLGQIAGSVSHELRNPLGVINNAIYFLNLVQPEADEKIKKYHDMIEHEVQTADKIIGDLLNFARLKSADRELVAIPELVQRVMERFPAPASVKVALKIPADLPMVFADPRQVEQVLGNLVTNACQAMVSTIGVAKGGKLTVRGDCVGAKNAPRNDNSQQWVRIAVKDTGTGITPENMPKLFEPLFSTKVKGIGLGLMVSQKLAEANGGRIEVESEPGKGSTFTVYLPVQEVE